MNRIKSLRSELGYTQQVLAEKSNLSLRTIQRIESGATIPKGYTLKALSKALEIEPQLLINTVEKVDFDLIRSKIRLINLSALAFLGLPFGNILIPVMVWQKNKRIDLLIKEAGKQIINFQIWWSIFLSILLSISPFIQSAFLQKTPLILIVLLVGFSLNLFFMVWVSTQINKGNYHFFNTRFGLL